MEWARSAQAVDVVTQLAAALNAAHAAGLVRRDIKPGNILLTEPAPGFGAAAPAGWRATVEDYRDWLISALAAMGPLWISSVTTGVEHMW